MPDKIFHTFEELLHEVQSQLSTGQLDVSDEFLEQQWDEDVLLLAEHIAASSGVSTKAAIFAVLWAFLEDVVVDMSSFPGAAKDPLKERWDKSSKEVSGNIKRLNEMLDS